jgi:hypothetical protein
MKITLSNTTLSKLWRLLPHLMQAARSHVRGSYFFKVGIADA